MSDVKTFQAREFGDFIRKRLKFIVSKVEFN